MILAVAADGIFGASRPPVFFCSLASSVNFFLACACKLFHFSLTSVVVLRATPMALTASAILHHISFFFWFVTLFVSLLCIMERFSSTFSVKMAILDALNFVYGTLVHFLMTYERSFMKMLNNKGPRMDPCGTPLHIGCQLESVSPSLTLWNRFDK